MCQSKQYGRKRQRAYHGLPTFEELDFIIGYDIKYRMGQDSGEGEQLGNPSPPGAE